MTDFKQKSEEILLNILDIIKSKIEPEYILEKIILGLKQIRNETLEEAAKIVQKSLPYERKGAIAQAIREKIKGNDL